jgi:hypothetical protein
MYVFFYSYTFLVLQVLEYIFSIRKENQSLQNSLVKILPIVLESESENGNKKFLDPNPKK